jgi:hypothetical protein
MTVLYLIKNFYEYPHSLQMAVARSRCGNRLFLEDE